MNNAEYLLWIEKNCPIGVSKENFVAFLAIKTIYFLEQAKIKSGLKIPYLIYEVSDHYKDLQVG